MLRRKSDGQAPESDEAVSRGRRTGAKTILRHWRGCNKEEGTEKHRVYHCPLWREVRNQTPDGLEKWEQRAKTSGEYRKWQSEIASHSMVEGNWRKTLVGPQMEKGKAQKLWHGS